MPIKYASVFDEKKERIAEHPKQVDEPKYSEVALKLAATLDPSTTVRRSIQDQETAGLSYCVLCNGEGRILISAGIDIPTRTSFAMLDAIEPLVRCPASQIRNGKKLIQMKMDFYNNPQNDKIANLLREVDAVAEIVSADIGKALDRGEKLDQVAAKTTTLREQATAFHQSSVAAKEDMLWRNIRLIGLIVAGVAAAALLIALISCRPDFSAC